MTHTVRFNLEESSTYGVGDLQNTVTQFTHWVVRFRNFWISLVGLASITAFVWFFDQIDDLSIKIFLNTLSAIVSVTFLSSGFSSDPEQHKLSWSGVWIALISVAGLVILIGDRYDVPALVLNPGSIISSLPALWMYRELTRGRPLLQILDCSGHLCSVAVLDDLDRSDWISFGCVTYTVTGHRVHLCCMGALSEALSDSCRTVEEACCVGSSNGEPHYAFACCTTRRISDASCLRASER